MAYASHIINHSKKVYRYSLSLSLTLSIFIFGVYIVVLIFKCSFLIVNIC